MDLLDCPACESRFLVRDAGSGEGWICRRCGAALRLIVTSLEGDLARIGKALHAHHLTPDGDEEARRIKGFPVSPKAPRPTGRRPASD